MPKKKKAEAIVILPDDYVPIPTPKPNVVVKSLINFQKADGLRWTVGQVRTIQRTLYEYYLTVGGRFEIIREED